MIIMYHKQVDLDSFLLVWNKYMFTHKHHKVLSGWSWESVNLIIIIEGQI